MKLGSIPLVVLTSLLGFAMARAQTQPRAASENAGKVPASAPSADQSQPARQLPPGARSSTKPGRFEAGDVLVIQVGELNGPGTMSDKPVRVDPDGTVRLYYLAKPIEIAGMTHVEAQAAIAKAYKDERLVENAMVLIRRLMVGGPESQVEKLENFDLVRLVVCDVTGPGSETVLIVRIGPDGTVGLPVVGPVKLAGLTTSDAELAISKQYNEQKIIERAAVSAFRLEAAPADAAQMSLPDAAVYPVSPAQLTLYEVRESVRRK